MENETQIEPCMVQAIAKIENYIEKSTGEKASQEEVATALTRYFVLKEIRAFIEMSRLEQ